MSSGQDLYLEVSKDFVKNSQGFAMDIGGSTAKVAYLRKDEWETVMKDETNTTAKLRLAIFLREDITDALQFVKDNCYIPRDGKSKPRMYMTGGGCQQYGPMIEKELDIKIMMTWEQGMVVKALLYLSKTVPQNQFEYPLSAQCQADTLGAAQRTRAIYAMINFEAKRPGSMMLPSGAQSLDISIAQKIIEAKLSHLPVTEIFPDFFPFIRFQISSSGGILVIYPDGKYRLVSAAYPGGRSFLGLGQLVCGCQKTFDELVDMAEKGCNMNVDQSLRALTSVPAETTAGSDPKEEMQDQEVLYVLGQAAAKHPDTFKKEDLVRAMLHLTARYQMALLQNMALKMNVKHVLAVGSFFTHELVRSVFSEEFVRQKVMLAAAFDGEGLDVHLHFVKMCAYLGNLGALIESSEDEAVSSISTDNPYLMDETKSK